MNRLEQIKTEQEIVEDELKRLEEKRKKLVKENSSTAKGIDYLSERQEEVKGKQEHTFKRWLMRGGGGTNC
jgi:hypothetical protein